MKAIWKRLETLVFLGIFTIVFLGYFILRRLWWAIDDGRPVPDWFRDLHAVIRPYAWPIFGGLMLYLLWDTVRIARPPKRPRTIDLTSETPENDRSVVSENDTLALPATSANFQRISGMNADWGLSTGSSYLDFRIIGLAGLMIWLVLEFLRRVLLPDAANQWIDTHHLQLAVILLSVAGLYWIYDSLFAPLKTTPARRASESAAKKPPRAALIFKRLGVCLVVFIAVATYNMNWVTYEFDLGRHSIEYYLFGAGLTLLASLLTIRR